MCKERWRTRDLLLEYDIPTLKPRTAGLSMVYPWENMAISSLGHQLYIVAKQSGFTGNEQFFINNFGAFLENRPIIYANFIDFPEEGEETKLYFDLDEKILYYWDNEYIPVNAMLIANTTINGGEA